jgi:import inner membrane translocase subunit TIM10
MTPSLYSVLDIRNIQYLYRNLPLTTLSNRLVNSCHTKCISPDPQSHRYVEPELLKGEAVCIDRCTAKFFEVNKKVGERMSAMGGQAQGGGGFGR